MKYARARRNRDKAGAAFCLETLGAGIDAGDLAFFLVMALVFLAAWQVWRIGARIKAEHPVGMSYLALAALLGAYVLLVCHCFLGGWQVLG